MIQHQAAKAVMVVTTVKIPLSSFSKYQQQQQPQQQQQFQQLEVHCSFLLPVSLKFLIAAKSLIEMAFTY